VTPPDTNKYGLNQWARTKDLNIPQPSLEFEVFNGFESNHQIACEYEVSEVILWCFFANMGIGRYQVAASFWSSPPTWQFDPGLVI